MKKIILVLAIFVVIIVIATVFLLNRPREENEQKNNIPLIIIPGNSDNPELDKAAAIYCQEQGGIYEVRGVKSGESGVCVFDNGESECGGRAFYQGTCQKGDRPSGPFNPALFENEHIMDFVKRYLTAVQNKDFYEVKTWFYTKEKSDDIISTCAEVPDQSAYFKNLMSDERLGEILGDCVKVPPSFEIKSAELDADFGVRKTPDSTGKLWIWKVKTDFFDKDGKFIAAKDVLVGYYYNEKSGFKIENWNLFE